MLVHGYLTENNLTDGWNKFCPETVEKASESVQDINVTVEITAELCSDK